MTMRNLSGILLLGMLGAACSAEAGDDGDGTAAPGATGTDALPGMSPGASNGPATSGPNPGASGPSAPAGSDSAGPNTDPTAPGTNPGVTEPGTSPEGTAPPAGTDCVPGLPVTSQVPRLLNREYDNAIRDLLGMTEVPSNGNLPPSAFLVDDLEGNMTSTAWNAYLDAAESIAADVMAGDSSLFIQCDPAAEGCLRSTVESFGRKAFRRPLTTEEVDSFMRLDNLEPKGEPEEVAEAILYAFLASPSFISLPELSEQADETVPGAFKLSNHEVATRLAMLIWGSIPDDVLNAAADAGELQTADQILAQAQRMVAVREKVGPLLSSFHRYYADIRNGSHWNTLDHDPALYPDFDKDSVNPAMMAEIDAFFADVAFNGTFKDLLLSNVAFVNQDTAALYDLNPADFGPELERVELDATVRPGFLTRIGFLSSYSRFDSTSPILRGAYINKNILDIDPGPPVEGAFDAQPPEADYQTMREYTDALTSPAECKGCHHTVINPPGYVLEVFDAVGAVQDQDPLGGAINSTADVVLPSGVKTISSPHQLMTELAASDAPRLRYAEQWVAYATGRSPNANDACVVQGLGAALTSESYTIVNLLADLSKADFVRLRTAAQ